MPNPAATTRVSPAAPSAPSARPPAPPRAHGYGDDAGEPRPRPATPPRPRGEAPARRSFWWQLRAVLRLSAER